MELLAETKKETSTKGTSYCASAYTMDELHEKGKATLLIFHPIMPLHRNSFKNCDMHYHHGLAYNVKLCTDNPEVLLAAIHDYYSKMGKYEKLDYNITRNSTKTFNTERNSKFPFTINLNIGLHTPFELSHLKELLPSDFNFYMSSIYNNGMIPTTNFWFYIPEEYKEERNRLIARNKRTGDGRIIGDLREYDKALLHKILENDPNYPVYYRFPCHERHTTADSIDSDFSIRVYGTGIDRKFRPLDLGTCTVEVVDCLMIRHADKYKGLVGIKPDREDYQSRMFSRVAMHSSPYIFGNTWMTNFVKHKKGSPHHSISIPKSVQDNVMGSTLIQVVEVTVNK